MADPDRSARRVAEVRRLSLVLIGLCLIQFLLGMVLNLFVAITRHHPGARGSDYFGRAFQSVLWAVSHGGFLAFHVGLGLLLFLASLRLAAAVFGVPGSGVRTVGVLGAVSVLAAGINGASFLNFNEDFSSMIMASLFAVAVFCFSWVLFRVSSEAHQPLPSPS